MNKIFNWTIGSLFRTFGRILAYLLLGGLIALILSKNSIKLPKLSDLLLFEHINASEQRTFWSTLYLDSNRSNSGSSVTLTSNLDLNYTSSKFYWANNSISIYDYQNGYVLFPFTLTTPVLGVSNSSTIEGNLMCEKWEYYTITTNENVLAWSCTRYTEGDDSSLTDREFVTPTSSIKATLHTKHNNVGYEVACLIDKNYIKCPINYGVDYLDYIDINTNVSYGSSNITKQYKLDLTDFFIVEYDTSSLIIDNQNQNTQQIIQEQEASTNATIQNQNQNTQDTINSQQVCKKIDKANVVQSGYFVASGNIATSSSAGITDYISVNSATIKVLQTYENAIHMCYYNTNKSLISCQSENGISTSSIDIPSAASYVRFSINILSNKPQFEICQNGNQAMADTITDDDVGEAENSATSFFDDFEVSDYGGLSGIITAPLNTISNLVSNTCTPLVLPLPFVNQNLTLPCLDSIYSEHFGSFYTIYQAILLAIISYRCIRSLFYDTRGFINPEDDRIEVLDL